MKFRFKLTLLIALFTLTVNVSQAQLNKTIALCNSHMQLPFVSDGQSYTALLNGDETAEFHATFYGNSTYRIVGYSGDAEGNLIFSVYDTERNLLFSNKDYQNVPNWDFKFDYTMNCIIEAQLDQKNIASGIAVMMIGFEQ